MDLFPLPSVSYYTRIVWPLERDFRNTLGLSSSTRFYVYFDLSRVNVAFDVVFDSNVVDEFGVNFV